MLKLYQLFYRCLVQQCENASNTEFAPFWLANALPSNGGSFESCKRFADNNLTYDISFNDSCPADLFDPYATLPCDKQVYENTQTVVYDVST